MRDHEPSLVESDLSAGASAKEDVLSGSVSMSERDALRTAHATAKLASGFTLAELLVSVGVLVLLTLLATQLLNSAATIMTLGHRQMNADSQARELFERM